MMMVNMNYWRILSLYLPVNVEEGKSSELSLCFKWKYISRTYVLSKFKSHFSEYLFFVVFLS